MTVELFGASMTDEEKKEYRKEYNILAKENYESRPSQDDENDIDQDDSVIDQEELIEEFEKYIREMDNANHSTEPHSTQLSNPVQSPTPR